MKAESKANPQEVDSESISKALALDLIKCELRLEAAKRTHVILRRKNQKLGEKIEQLEKTKRDWISRCEAQADNYNAQVSQLMADLHREQDHRVAIGMMSEAELRQAREVNELLSEFKKIGVAKPSPVGVLNIVLSHQRMADNVAKICRLLSIPDNAASDLGGYMHMIYDRLVETAKMDDLTF